MIFKYDLGPEYPESLVKASNFRSEDDRQSFLEALDRHNAFVSGALPSEWLDAAQAWRDAAIDGMICWFFVRQSLWCGGSPIPRTNHQRAACCC